MAFKMKGYSPFTQKTESYVAKNMATQVGNLKNAGEAMVSGAVIGAAAGTGAAEALSERVTLTGAQKTAKKLKKVFKEGFKPKKMNKELKEGFKPSGLKQLETKKVPSVPKKEKGSNPPNIAKMLKAYEKLEAMKNRTAEQKAKMDSLGTKLDNYYQDDNRG